MFDHAINQIKGLDPIINQIEEVINIPQSDQSLIRSMKSRCIFSFFWNFIHFCISIFTLYAFLVQTDNHFLDHTIDRIEGFNSIINQIEEVIDSPQSDH